MLLKTDEIMKTRIQKTELRIGNFIREIDTGGEFPVANIITQPNDDWTGVEPIPITEDWLSKFGFEKSTAWFRKGNHAINLMIAGLYEFKNIPIKEVSYVHELQNLYFALTGEELSLK